MFYNFNPKKRKFNQNNNLIWTPKNPTYWNLRNGNSNFQTRGNLTVEEVEYIKSELQRKKEEEEINRDLIRKAEVEKRWKEITSNENQNENEKIKILEKEIKKLKRKIECLEEENEDLTNEIKYMKEKNSKLKKSSMKKIPNETSSDDEEEVNTEEENPKEEEINPDELNKELTQVIDGKITETKIKALGVKKLKTLCNKLNITYTKLGDISKKLYNSL